MMPSINRNSIYTVCFLLLFNFDTTHIDFLTNWLTIQSAYFFKMSSTGANEDDSEITSRCCNNSGQSGVENQDGRS